MRFGVNQGIGESALNPSESVFGAHRRPLRNRGVVELLNASAVLSAVIAGVEVFGSVLPIPVFLVAAALLLIFIPSLAVAHRRGSAIATATVWIFGFSIVLGHLLYATYYLRVDLVEPLALFILGAASLSAPVLAASIALRPPPRATRGGELPSGTQGLH